MLPPLVTLALAACTAATIDLPYLCCFGNRRRCSSLLGLCGRADAAGIPDWRVPAPTGRLSGPRRWKPV